MEENKDKELEKKPVDQIPDDVEEVATAEDVEAFMRERRKKREEKKAVVEKYIALLAENYAKGIQVIAERGGKLDIAKYELETLKLKKSIADDSDGALFSGNVDDAVAAVRRLIKEYDALEKVKAATERPVVPEQVVAAPAFDADLVKQLDSDLGVTQPAETDEEPAEVETPAEPKKPARKPAVKAPAKKRAPAKSARKKGT